MIVPGEAENARRRESAGRRSKAHAQRFYIEGEAIGAAEAVARAGISDKTFRKRYRDGLRTWQGLKTGKRA